MSARSWGCTGLLAVVLLSCTAVPLSDPSPVVEEPPAAVMAAALDERAAERSSVSTTVAPAQPAATPSTTTSTAPPVPWPTPAAMADDGSDAAPMPEAPPTFEGPAPTAPPPAMDRGPAGDGIWAVIVGIDDYPGRSHDLRSAGNDADDMDAVLSLAGSPPHQRLRLSDGQATADVLRRALDWLVDRAGPDATAVFFFAGHVRQLGSGTEAMVGSDGGLVRDVEVARRLRGLRAARTWVVIAACYAGGFDEVLAPGRILTAAAPAGRLAYENLSMRRSYLVEYVLRRAVLHGRAPGSVEDAFAWGATAIRREHPGRVPVQFDRLDGELPLVTGMRTADRSPPPSSPPPPPPRDDAPSRPAPTTTTTTPPPEEEEQQSCGITGLVLRCPED